MFIFLQRAFYEHVDRFGPNDYNIILSSFNKSSSDIESVRAVLQFTDWDSDITLEYISKIIDHILSYPDDFRIEIIEGLEKAWENYFQLDNNLDFISELGRFYLKVSNFEKALKLYELYNSFRPNIHPALINIGMCLYHLGNNDIALSFFKRANSFKPGCKQANYWINLIEN
jgi:tetratricopeptide (TPR) repeat protein